MPAQLTPIRSLALALAALAAVPAVAQDAPPSISRADFLARAEQRFQAMDADHDGKATRAEYDAAVAARGGRPAMGGRGFDRMDGDGDGIVTAAEARDTAGRLFDMMDANHDGSLSAEEREAMRGMGGGMRAPAAPGATPPAPPAGQGPNN